MATIKKSKVTVSFLGIIGILLIATLLLVPATQARAETVKFRVVNYLVRVEWSPVGDVEGHLIGFFLRGGLVFYENGEVATYSARGSFDSIKGRSSYEGYGLTTFEDGSTIVSKIQGTLTPIEGTKQRSGKGTGEYIKGTGRFEGIKGSLSYTGKQVTPYSKKEGTFSDAYYDVTATYTVPSK